MARARDHRIDLTPVPCRLIALYMHLERGSDDAIADPGPPLEPNPVDRQGVDGLLHHVEGNSQIEHPRHEHVPRHPADRIKTQHPPRPLPPHHLVLVLVRMRMRMRMRMRVRVRVGMRMRVRVRVGMRMRVRVRVGMRMRHLPDSASGWTTPC
jgi:hypothetical protein